MHLALHAAALAALLGAAPAAAELKVGFVDFQRALNEVEEGKVARASLKRDFDDKQKILDKEKADLDRLQAEFEKQAAVMSDDAKRERLLEMDRKGRDAAMKMQQFQKELSEREREMTRGIGDKMMAIVRELADSEGFTMVFEKNDAGLLFAPPSLDLTNELIRKYNARHKPAGAASSGGKKPDAAEKKADAPEKKAKK
jgi:outer membrane protein